MSPANEFMPRATRPRVCPIRTAAARLAAERRYLGITNVLLQQAAQATSTHVGTVLAKMHREGKLFGVTVTGHPRHWFITAEVAQQWATATAPKVKPTPTPRQQMLHGRREMPAPGTLAPSARHGEPIITARTKITRDTTPRPTARWQTLPDAPAGQYPRFSAGRPGTDPDTGKAWEPRA